VASILPFFPSGKCDIGQKCRHKLTSFEGRLLVNAEYHTFVAATSNKPVRWMQSADKGHFNTSKINRTMGLFSFLKNAGTSLFGGKKAEAGPAAPAAPSALDKLEDAQLALRLTNHVTSLELKVENLNIVVDDDKATITGTAASQSEKEKVILAVGNVAGIASVDDWMTVAVAEEAAPEPEAVFYTVEKGDTLSKIAKEHYGNANKYPTIFEANKPMLKDVDKIYPGQVLRIPPIA